MDLKIYTLVNNIHNNNENDFFEDNKKDIINEINDIVKTKNFDVLLKTIADDKFYNVLTD